MSFEVVAVPEFAPNDLEWIVRMRRSRAGNKGPPYFTLVFPGSDLDAPHYTAQVKAVARQVKRIRFRLRSAMVVPDPQVQSFHVFLVPDEGFSTIIRLHERLHGGALSVCQRLDMPYIPHLTIASERDIDTARSVASGLNAKDIAISGRIDSLVIQRREGEVVKLIGKHDLASGGLFG